MEEVIELKEKFMYSKGIHIQRCAMEATVLDLRYKMKDVQQALRRRETVKIKYHGKIIGKILPFPESPSVKIESHPFFGMSCSDEVDVESVMEQLRGGRTGDL